MPRRATATSFGGIAGNAKNRAGSIGRPDDAIRARARESWGKRLHRLEKIADGSIKKAQVSDWIAAMREMRAVGFPDRHEVTGNDGGPIQVQVMIIGGREVKF